MNIAICDDVAIDRKQLADAIEAYCLKIHIRPVFYFYKSGKDLLTALKTQQFNLIFLDYYMNGLSGGETAEKICCLYPEVPIVFVTTAEENALECYDYAPLHFLVKPLREKRIAEVFERLDRRTARPTRYISITVNKITRPVALNHILYAEVSGRILTLHIADGETIDTYKTMRTLEKELSDDQRFLRSHQSFMVNLDYVEEDQNEYFLMKDGAHVPIRQHNAAAIHQAYREYIFHKMRES